MAAYTGKTQKLTNHPLMRMHYTTMAEDGTHLIGHTVQFRLESHTTLTEYWNAVVAAGAALFDDTDGLELLIPVNSIIGIKQLAE